MTPSGVLDGLRVLNLSSNLGGAVVGQFFADHGAEVVLIEPPGGSPLRRQAGWPIWSRGSKSVEAVLDDSAVRSLALAADVLVDTSRPGVTERHRLGYEQLTVGNPRLVYTAITGFGRAGPLADLPAYEGVVMAKLGAYSQFSAMTARPGPAFATVPYGTVSAAELAVTGTLVALYERERSGRGQRVDTSMVQGIAAHDTWNWMAAFWARKFSDAFAAAPVVNPSRQVPNSWLSYGLLVSLTADGRWLQFSQANPKQFRAFLDLTGLGDPTWNDAWQDEDLDRREAFWERLLAAVRAKTVAEWQSAFDAHPDVFAEIFRSGTELLHHPQLLHDDMIATIERPGLGRVREPRPFVRLSPDDGACERPLPDLDQHRESLNWPLAAPDGEGAPPPPSGSPLAGVTIVELGTFYAAPFGATILADLGARVVKIEQLDGDPIRFQLPCPEVGGVKVTQGKQSVAIDITTPEGLDILKALVARADVVLQSFRAGVAERLGVDAGALRAVNPDLVYHEAPGFGTSGPYGHRPAYAPTIGAASGMTRRNIGAAVPERPDLALDEVKDGAIRMGVAGLTAGHPDGFASLGVACGLALGLLARARGRGTQRVMTTMLSTLAEVLSEDMVEYDGRPAAPTADPNLLGFGPLYRLYETAAGWVFLAAPGEQDWGRLVSVVSGLAGLARTDPGVTAVLENAFRAQGADAWEARLSAAGVGCAAVVEGSAHDVLMLPGGLGDQLGITTEVEHPIFGVHPRLTALVEFSRSTTRAEAGVTIGQHTAAVLAELGFSNAEIADLAERKVVGLG